MSERKHTPGPWTAYHGWPDTGPLAQHPQWWSVTSAFDTGWNRLSVNGHFGEANAHLIASAPDLLQSCQLALEALEALQGGCTDSDDGTVEALTVWCPEVIESLTAAIAKATGEQP